MHRAVNIVSASGTLTCLYYLLSGSCGLIPPPATNYILSSLQKLIEYEFGSGSVVIL